MLVGIKKGWEQSQTKAWGLGAQGAWHFVKDCYKNVIQSSKDCWAGIKGRWSDTRANFKERPVLTFVLTLFSPLRWVANVVTGALKVTKDAAFATVTTVCYVVEGAAAVITDTSDVLVAGVHKAAEKFSTKEPAAIAA